MNNKKLEQLQKMYEDGLITEDELKLKREKVISEIVDANEESQNEENHWKSPKKKHKYLKIFLIVIFVIFGLSIIGYVFDDENESQNQESKVEKIEKTTGNNNNNEKPINKIGKWYELNENYEIKISKIEMANYYQYGDTLLKPDNGNTYISVYFSYRNVSNVPVLHLKVDSNEFRKFYLQSPEGKVYKLDVFGSAVLFYETLSIAEKFESSLNNGYVDKGYLKPFTENFETGKNGIAFEVPKNKIQEKGWKLIVNNMEFLVKM